MKLSALEREIFNQTGRLKNLDNPPLGSPWSVLPSARDEIVRALAAAEAQLAELRDEVRAFEALQAKRDIEANAVRIERALRAGDLELLGRPDRAAPFLPGFALGACKGLKFNSPEHGAVTLASGQVLFDCHLQDRQLGHTDAAAQIYADRAEEPGMIDQMIRSLEADGRTVTQSAVEQAFAGHTPKVRVESIRARLHELGLVGSRGRPGKPAEKS